MALYDGNWWVNETRRHLFSGQREEMNKLYAYINNSATSLTLTYDVGGIQAGSVIEIDLELMYVWSVVSATKVVTVERHWLGSAADEHFGDAVIRVNPKFPNFSISVALDEEVDDLSSPQNGLFQMLSLDVTYNPTYRGYDLTGIDELLDIYEVRYKSTGPDRYWPLIDRWEVSRVMATGEFASTIALFLSDAADSGSTVHVRYKAPFTELASVDSTLSSTGIPYTAWDIPPLGAAARLVAPREVKQGFSEHQGEPRRATEVPPGTNLRSAQALLGLRDRRISAERARLHQLYPPRARRAG